MSDKKLQHSTDGTTVDYYNADVVTAQDFYPFGMTMPGRKFAQANSNYRYGFNGQERSSEIGGDLYTAQFWEYDSRIGKRWNVDPVVKPWESPYICFSGNPISRIDPDGAEAKDIIYRDRNKKEIGRKVTKDNFDQFITVLQGAINPETSETSKDYKQGGMTTVYHHRYDKASTPTQAPSQAPINNKTTPPVSKQKDQLSTSTKTGIVLDAVTNTAVATAEAAAKAVSKISPSKTVGTILKVTKAVNVVAIVATTTLTVVDAYKNKFQDKHFVDLMATSMSLLPVIGQAWGILWFVGNVVSYGTTGKSISENIQEQTNKANPEEAVW